MYLIALCDDAAGELEQTENLLREYEKTHPGSEFVAEQFVSSGELLYRIREENYLPDLIFMDVFMPDKMGIKVAEELRDMGYTGKLVFLTRSKEYALEAFAVDALQYLVKPVSRERLFSVLDKFVKDIEEEQKRFILLKIARSLMRVPVKDIVCCEASGKTQRLYLADGTEYLLRMTMTGIYELLSGYREFVRIGGSYIVNFEYVDSLNVKKIHMENGCDIYLPRGAYKELREQYFRYYSTDMP